MSPARACIPELHVSCWVLAMVLPYDDNLESICRESASILQELAAQVREAGEPISWGPSDERVDKFFKWIAFPSPEHGKIAERRAKRMQVMHFNLELLAGSESDLGKVCSIGSVSGLVCCQLISATRLQ